MVRVTEYESSIVGSYLRGIVRHAGHAVVWCEGTYSCVHWLRTRRSVIDDFPQPPSPQTVIEILCESSMSARSPPIRSYFNARSSSSRECLAVKGVGGAAEGIRRGGGGVEDMAQASVTTG